MVATHPLESDVGLFLIQCLLIIIISRVVTYLFSKIQQPPVIAEIISGILLGPTALGKIPGFSENLFTPTSIKILNVFAQIGLIFFMFIIGLELDPTLFKSQIKKSAIISFVSIVFPFGLGIAASVFLADIQGTAWSYSLGIFIGVALCITAFPVLARILTSKKLLSTPIGILAIACAAINDICGWILLGLSVSLAGSSNSLDTLWTLLAAAGFCFIMLVVVRPILARVVAKIWIVQPGSTHLPSPSHLVMSGTLLLLFTASWCTEVIGIHAMFGSFVLGAITPKIGAFNQAITEKIEDLVLVFLLPLYFVISGLRTDLTTLNTGKSWLGVLVIILCACVGKIIGAGTCAKFLGFNTRDSFSIGVLMNTRGLVELIVLNLGLDFGIIHTQVFGIMVLMAVFTTILTSPIISLVMKENKKKPASNELNVVFCTSSLEIGPSIVDLGFVMVGGKSNTTPIHPTFINRKKLKKMYILALSEVNERPSDFIGQIRKDMSKSTYSHLLSQGNQMKMRVSFHQICSDHDHISKEVIQFTENKSSNLLIISEPSHGHSRVISSDVTFNLIKNSISHVGVFTDKSGTRGNFNRFKKVIVVYLGGKNPNDEETLSLINKMSETDGIQITIVVFDNDAYWRHKKSEAKKHMPLGAGEGLDTSNIMNNSNLPIKSIQNSNIIMSPEGVPIDGSSEVKKNTEIYDPKTLEQFENHLEKVINGKNSMNFTVIYKPKKSKINVLRELCPNFDILVVPYEATNKVVQQTPFPSFSVPDLMRKSFSMVHLPGGKKQQQVYEMESVHSGGVGDDDFSDHPNIKESTSSIRKSSHTKSLGNQKSFADLNNLPGSPRFDSNNSNFDGSSSTTSGIPTNNNNNNNPLKSSEGFDMDENREDDNSNNSNGSSGDSIFEDKPYWTRCPISTLVIYQKDTIPIQSDLEDLDQKVFNNSNGSGSNNNNNIIHNNNHHFIPDNLEPYEVDPSVLPITDSSGSIQNTDDNNNSNNNNNNDLSGSDSTIPKDKAE